MPINQTRETVRIWLESQTFGEALDWFGVNVLYWDSDAETKLKGFVVPQSINEQAGTRQGLDSINQIEIAVLQKLEFNTPAEELARQDKLLELVREIKARLLHVDQIGGQLAQIPTNVPTAPMNPEAAQKQIFLGSFFIDFLETAPPRA